MGIYHPGNGRTGYYGNDKTKKVEQLREEAHQHDKNSDTYSQIGYKGHSVSEGREANRKRKEADRIERYGS